MVSKWLCEECGWAGAEHLTADNPFDLTEKIAGCPKCKQAETLVAACDHEGCEKPATCGTMMPQTYRTTCYEHMPRL